MKGLGGQKMALARRVGPSCISSRTMLSTQREGGRLSTKIWWVEEGGGVGG